MLGFLGIGKIKAAVEAFERGMIAASPPAEVWKQVVGASGTVAMYLKSMSDAQVLLAQAPGFARYASIAGLDARVLEATLKRGEDSGDRSEWLKSFFAEVKRG
jgi:hypothetical protein